MVQKIEIKETNIDGVSEISTDEWDGRIFRMSREAYRRWCDVGTPPDTAVYLLYADHFDKPTYGKQLYVGHTGQVASRIDVHLTDKDYWSAVLVLISRADWMNVAYTKNIEHRFIEWAKLANRYEVKNRNDSAVTNLRKEDTSRLDKFLFGIRPVFKLAGIDLFELNLDGVYTYEKRIAKSVYISRIRIEDLGSPIRIRILSGSEISGLSEVEINQSGLMGITYDPTAHTHSFSEDTVIAVDMEVIPKVFGYHLMRWCSPCGVKLSDVLKKSK